MKILLIADIHNRPLKNGKSIKAKIHNFAKRKTLKDIKWAIDNVDNDLIVFLGDTVHGPDFQGIESEYEQCLREVLDLTLDNKFAYVFGNHDDECAITKEEILAIVDSYPNSVTNGRDYLVEMMDESLLFLDSGSYYDGEGSYYDTVKEEQIRLAEEKLEGRQGIVFQHIIVPDIMDLVEESDKKLHESVRDGKKYYRLNPELYYFGVLGEKPCPPDINTGELDRLSHCVKAMCFGHDHKNSFEFNYKDVQFIQCAGASYNSYDKFLHSSVKLLDTETLVACQIYM